MKYHRELMEAIRTCHSVIVSMPFRWGTKRFFNTLRSFHALNFAGAHLI